MSTLVLNSDQQKALQTILDGNNLFLTGGAGTGKSVVTIESVRQLKQLHPDWSIEVLAMTRLAANRVKGKTVHKFLGLGKITEDDFKDPERLFEILHSKKEKCDLRTAANKFVQISTGTNKPRTYTEMYAGGFLHKHANANANANDNASDCVLYRWPRVLILEEGSQFDVYTISALDAIGQIANSTNKPFGGSQFIVVGDFFQLGPIIESDYYIFETKAWKETITNIIELTEIFRQGEDKKYADICNSIRIGKTNTNLYKMLTNRCIVPNTNKTRDGLTTVSDDTYAIYARRDKVIAYNTDISQRITGKYIDCTPAVFFRDHIYNHGQLQQVDTPVPDWQHASLLELFSVQPPFIFKNNMQVSYILNDTDNTLYNGCIGTIFNLIYSPYQAPVVEFENGVTKIMNPVEMTAIEPKTNKTVVIRAIPLKVAHAWSIHSVQGLTFENLRLALDNSLFAFGHAYVALSRLTNFLGLAIEDFDIKCFKTSKKVFQYYSKYVWKQLV
jgi:hypothetical protein